MKRIILPLAVTAATNAYAAQDYCGRISSLPDGFVLYEKKQSEIFFAGDDSMPPDPKKVYDYLNTHHKDSDRNCYCIVGSVLTEKYGTQLERRFSMVSGFKTCGGTSLR